MRIVNAMHGGRRRLAAGISCIALATVLVASPAVADTIESFNDPAEDAPARVDITRIRAVSNDDLVKVAVRVRGALPRKGLVIVRIADWDQAYTFRATKDGSRFHRSAIYMSDEGRTSPLHCAWKIRWRKGDDTLKVTIPRNGRDNCLYTDEWTYGTALKVVLRSGEDQDRWLRS